MQAIRRSFASLITMAGVAASGCLTSGAALADKATWPTGAVASGQRVLASPATPAVRPRAAAALQQSAMRGRRVAVAPTPVVPRAAPSRQLHASAPTSTQAHGRGVVDVRSHGRPGYWTPVVPLSHTLQRHTPGYDGNWGNN